MLTLTTPLLCRIQFSNGEASRVLAGKGLRARILSSAGGKVELEWAGDPGSVLLVSEAELKAYWR